MPTQPPKSAKSLAEAYAEAPETPHIYYTIDVLQRVGIVTDAAEGEHPPFRAAMMMVADYFTEACNGPDEEYEFILQNPQDPDHQTTVTLKS